MWCQLPLERLGKAEGIICSRSRLGEAKVFDGQRTKERRIGGGCRKCICELQGIQVRAQQVKLKLNERKQRP